MNLSRALILIGVMVGVGCLKAVQQNSLLVSARRVGSLIGQVHTQETQVSWLRAKVVGLRSPAHLSEDARTRQLDLTAWSALSPEPGQTTGEGSSHRLAAAKDAP